MNERKHIRITLNLWRAAAKAIRLGARDSRNTDRVLHNETIDALQQADDLVRDFLDERGGVS